MEARMGMLQTEYGKSVCDLLAAQVTILLRSKDRTANEACDLLEIKRALMKMRKQIVWGHSAGGTKEKAR